MKITSKYTLGFRRKRKGQTDYRKRLKILTSKKPRLVVRSSLNNVLASVVTFNTKGDEVKATAHSTQLKKLGWQFSTSNMPAAYLVGYLLGKKAQKAGIAEAVFDIGLKKAIKKGKIYAVLAGAIEAGLTVPHGEDVLPEESRLKGEHIANHASSLKDNKEALEKQYSNHLKNKVNPEEITKAVDTLKAAIDKQ